MSGASSGHDHGGHDHLSHVPGAAQPAVFAARADVRFAQAEGPDELEAAVARFFAALAAALADAGCTLVGHIKGTLHSDGHGDLAFHATRLDAALAFTGGHAGLVSAATLTLNVIVFGVDEAALPAIVRRAWTRATGAQATWMG